MSDHERSALEERIANIEAELQLSKDQLAAVNAADEAARPKPPKEPEPKPVRHAPKKAPAKK